MAGWWGKTRSAAKKTRKGYKTAKAKAKPHVKRAKKVHGKARKASRAVSRTVKQGKRDLGGIFRQAGFK